MENKKEEQRFCGVASQIKQQGKSIKITASIEISLQWKETRQARQEKQKAMKSFQNSLNREATLLHHPS